DRELEGGGALGTERAAADGTLRIAFDVDDGVIAHTHQLGAADRTVRADAGHFLGIGDLETAKLNLDGPQIEPQAEQAAQGEAAGRPTHKITTRDGGEVRSGHVRLSSNGPAGRARRGSPDPAAGLIRGKSIARY